MIDTGGIVVIYVDRKHVNAYYDRYRNNWRTYYHRTVLPIMEKRKCGSSYDH
jgi:hypothetical protein